MKRLLTALRWDFLCQQRYQIITAAGLLTLLYIIVLLNVQWVYKDKLLIFLIFNDPAAIGMLFVGSLVLFEKSDRTLEALVVTPIRPWQYLWAKGLSLTIIATICSFAIAIAGHGWRFHFVYFGVAIVLTSLFFVFWGIIIVADSQSFNGYVIKMGLWLVPIALPFLNFIGITDTYFWYLIPSQPGLLLMEAAFGKTTALWEIVYAVSYLALATGGMYYFAERAFVRKLQNL